MPHGVSTKTASQYTPSNPLPLPPSSRKTFWSCKGVVLGEEPCSDQMTHEHLVHPLNPGAGKNVEIGTPVQS